MDQAVAEALTAAANAADEDIRYAVLAAANGTFSVPHHLIVLLQQQRDQIRELTERLDAHTDQHDSERNSS